MCVNAMFLGSFLEDDVEEDEDDEEDEEEEEESEWGVGKSCPSSSFGGA